MAVNSHRELILVEVVDMIEEVSSIKTVQRTRIGFSELGNYSGRQLPLVAVVGKLPKPAPKRSGREPGASDMFISDLGVDLFCYAMDNETPDSTVSNLADDLWAKIYSNPTLVTTQYPRGLALQVDVVPEISVGIWDPYIVFKMNCIYKYIHGTGGI